MTGDRSGIAARSKATEKKWRNEGEVFSGLRNLDGSSGLSNKSQPDHQEMVKGALGENGLHPSNLAMMAPHVRHQRLK
jgi:hypothetical protein